MLLLSSDFVKAVEIKGAYIGKQRWLTQKVILPQDPATHTVCAGNGTFPESLQ